MTVIQVAFGKVIPGDPRGGHRHTYAYRIPTDLDAFELTLFDRVIVPPNWAHPYSQIATFVDWGRGDYDGPLQDIEGIIRTTRGAKLSVAPTNTKVYTPDPYEHFERQSHLQTLKRVHERVESLTRQLESFKAYVGFWPIHDPAIKPLSTSPEERLSKRVSNLERRSGSADAVRELQERVGRLERVFGGR